MTDKSSRCMKILAQYANEQRTLTRGEKKLIDTVSKILSQEMGVADDLETQKDEQRIYRINVLSNVNEVRRSVDDLDKAVGTPSHPSDRVLQIMQISKIIKEKLDDIA